MIEIMKRGTLEKRANALGRATNATLLGSLEGEDFRDVEVVTLKQYAKDCAHREVMDNNQCILSYEDLEVKVDELAERKYNVAKEFISIEEDKILVGLNVEVVDNQAVDTAMVMLVELEEFEAGSFLTFGEPITLKF